MEASGGGPAVQRPEDRLDSWKEIAAYLGRDERTVRRWEKQEGLPVHRHVHQKQASVYASRAELDAWRRTRGATPLSRSVADAMPRISLVRVLLAGVAWFVAYNVLTGAAWGMLLRRSGLQAFHPLLGHASPPGFVRASAFLLQALAMGVSAMWFYAAVRSRYDARPLTVLCAGVALWWLWGLMPILPDIAMRSFPVRPLVFELVCKLLVILLSTLAGAWVCGNPLGRLSYAGPAPGSRLPAA